MKKINTSFKTAKASSARFVNRICGNGRFRYTLPTLHAAQKIGFLIRGKAAEVAMIWKPDF